jgi:hypothetical protein
MGSICMGKVSEPQAERGMLQWLSYTLTGVVMMMVILQIVYIRVQVSEFAKRMLALAGTNTSSHTAADTNAGSTTPRVYPLLIDTERTHFEPRIEASSDGLNADTALVACGGHGTEEGGGHVSFAPRHGKITFTSVVYLAVRPTASAHRLIEDLVSGRITYAHVLDRAFRIKAVPKESQTLRIALYPLDAFTTDACPFTSQSSSQHSITAPVLQPHSQQQPLSEWVANDLKSVAAAPISLLGYGVSRG